MVRALGKGIRSRLMINSWRYWDCFHEQRRLPGDFIDRGLNGRDIVDKATFFQLFPTVSTLRGHNMKLFIPRARLHVYISISEVTECFHTGIVCHNMLSTHLQITVSSQDWTNIGTIWTSKADKSLLVHQLSSSKFKKEGCQYSFVTYLSFKLLVYIVF